MFMCIRITKELKHVYESDFRIDLSKKIFYPTFCAILAKLGYLDQTKEINLQSRQLLVPSSNDPLVRLAWSTIRTICPIDEIDKSDETGPTEDATQEAK